MPAGGIVGLDRLFGIKVPPVYDMIAHRDNTYSRRNLLCRIASLSLSWPLSRSNAFPFLVGTAVQSGATVSHNHPASPPARSLLTSQDEEFLNELEHRSFLYFWEQANPLTGLVKDRCSIRTKDTSIVASIASTGFGLTALCIGEKRNFLTAAEARARVTATLSFLWHKLPTHRGFFYHLSLIHI